MHVASARWRGFEADMYVQHLMKYDVANEVLGDEVLIEEGMDTDEVVFRRIAPEPNRVAASSGRRHPAPGNGRIDRSVKVFRVHFVT